MINQDSLKNLCSYATKNGELHGIPNEEEKKLNEKIQKHKERICQYPTFILVEEDQLIGFVSLFEQDCEERKDLTPWHATLYVKEEYRGHHLSKVLNNALIEEAKRRNYERIYLTTYLVNFYEKYGFHYLETCETGEKIYYMDL